MVLLSNTDGSVRLVSMVRRRPALAVLLAAGLPRLMACLSIASANGDSRPQIRIAHLHPDDTVVTPVSFMMLNFDTPNRSLLPDFDVVIDVFSFRANTGQAPVQLTGILLGDTPGYHAVTGPFLRQDSLDVVDLTAKARILHVHAADNPILSDRTRYPYTFRATPSGMAVQRAMFYILSRNEWHAVASIWAEQDKWDASNQLAMQMNITNYAVVSEDGAKDWLVDAWQEDFITLVRTVRVKVAMVFASISTGWQLVCRVHRRQLLGMQYFVESRWGPGWFVDSYSPSLGNCTADEMYRAAEGHLQVLHQLGSPGLNLLNFLFLPSVGGDQSHIPLTCMPDMTANSFFNSPLHATMAIRDGLATDMASIQIYLTMAGSVTNMLCASLLALHDSIYNKGISLNSIESREPEAFSGLFDSMGKVELQGPQGSFRYQNGTGDPEYIYILLCQQAMPGKSNLSLDMTAVITFPDGEDHDPVVQIQNPEVPLQWRDGSTGLGPKPDLALFPDCGAQNSLLIWDSCEPCPRGTAYDALLQDCRTCTAGQYQNKSGADSCETSPPGWYVVDVEYPTEIAPCLLGHECPQFGMVSPYPCGKGRFASSPGQAACELCPRGHYQNDTHADGCVSCSSVVVGSITANIASTLPEECICPEGSFRPLGGNNCIGCWEGLVCPEGSDMQNLEQGTVPLIGDATAETQQGTGNLAVVPSEHLRYPHAEKGFMTRASAPLTVYKCKAEEHCPGGAPGSCDTRRDPLTVACGNCIRGAYESGEQCVECGSARALPFIVAGMVAVVLVVVATLLINKDAHKTLAASLSIVAVSGLLLTSLQALGVFSQLDIPWGEPMGAVLGLTGLLSFRLDLLKVACVMGVSPLRGFILRQAVVVLAIPFVWLTLLMKKYAPICGRRKTRVLVEFCNATGALYSVFFIAIIISGLAPFICYKHPRDSGESVLSIPSILCFQGGEHTSMIIISVIALCLVPLPFLCLCTYGVLMYPYYMRARSSGTFLLAMRFLFFRYVPKCHYFHTIMLTRSLCLCLVPAVFRAQPSMQLLCLCVTLCTYSILEEELHPWRVPFCNTLDAVLSLLLVMVLLGGALFVEGAPQKHAIAVLSSGIFGCLLISSVMVLVFALPHHLMSRASFDYFICHHKAHAAAQARYLKTVLTKKQRALQVFIDSDNLQELDSLFDVVKTRVRHLIVFLTAETLQRPWCVGEIVTAIRAKLQITRLQTPSFSAPTQIELDSPEKFVSTIGCNLREYGIGWHDVRNALTILLSSSVPELNMNANLPGSRRFEQLVEALLRHHVSGYHDDQVWRLDAIRGHGVVVSAHAASDEACAAGAILVDCIAHDVYRVCEDGLFLLCDYEANLELTMPVVREASVAVVILTPGCLQSLTQICVISELIDVQGNPGAPAMISVNTPGFEFPSPAMVDSLCAAQPFLEEAFPTAAEHVKAFFMGISIVLPTNASQHALETQAMEVFGRIRAFMKSKAGMMNSSSSSSTRMPSSGFSKATSSFGASWDMINRISDMSKRTAPLTEGTSAEVRHLAVWHEHDSEEASKEGQSDIQARDEAHDLGGLSLEEQSGDEDEEEEEGQAGPAQREASEATGPGRPDLARDEDEVDSSAPVRKEDDERRAHPQLEVSQRSDSILWIEEEV